MTDEIAHTQGLPAEPAEAAVQFQAEEVSKAKRKWQLTLHSGHVSLQPEGEPQPYIFLREDFFIKIEFQPGMRLLMLRVPPKVGLKLSKEAAEAVGRWFGVPSRAQLAVLLKRRYTLALPIALLFVLTSLPLTGSAATGTRGLSFNLENLGFGAALLVLWACAKWRPHPVLFLLDAFWFLLLAVGQFLLICRTHHWWGLIWTVLLVWMVVSGVNRYRQFRAGTSR